MRTKRGFTLIELLVAITVLAVVAVLGWRGLDSIVRARAALNNELVQTRGLQLAFAQMQSDAGHIVKAEQIGNRTLLSAETDRLTLVRTVFAENQPSHVQVISYRIRDGVLTRRESIATRDLEELDAAWAAAMSDAAVAPAVVLHSDVDEMTIRIWVDGSGWRVAAGAAPVAAAATGGNAQGTSGLEVALRLRDRQDKLVKIFLLGAA